MTNAEKYLKDGANIEEFIQEIEEELDLFGGQFNVERWLRTSSAPALSEDERVILKNIKSYTHIRRTDDGDLRIYCFTTDITTSGHSMVEYNHLFQFIKERRKIRDS